jgi:hypothetical protein
MPNDILDRVDAKHEIEATQSYGCQILWWYIGCVLSKAHKLSHLGRDGFGEENYLHCVNLV